MALQKTWAGGASGDANNYANAQNWQAISIRNSTYRWTASGSGTNEFYLELAAGGDPGLTEPSRVLASGSAMTAGTVGSLTAGQWDWGDNDTLGFSTIYVRLSDGADPDSKALDYLALQQIPVAGDHVTLPSTSTYAITTGLDQSDVTLGSFTAKGFPAAVGTSTAFLRLKTAAFTWNGTAQSYIDLIDSAIAPLIYGTAQVAQNASLPGLLLIGSAMTTLAVESGTVGVAWRSGETATLTNARAVGRQAAIWLGSGVTLTNAKTLLGRIVQFCACTKVEVENGQWQSEGSGTVGTLEVNGGNAISNSTGTVTAANLNGGFTDATQSALARTYTAVKLNPGAEFAYDPDILTVTGWTAPDRPVKLKASAAA